MIEFGVKTLLRYSDLCRIRWVDVLDKETLLLNEKKTNKRREITLGVSLREKIQTLYNELKNPSPNEIIFDADVPYIFAEPTPLSNLVDFLQLSLINISYHMLHCLCANFSILSSLDCFNTY